MILALVAALAIQEQIAQVERTLCSRTAVRTFYERRAYAPAWSEQNAAALRRAVERADDDGLDPQRYRVDESSPAADVLRTDAFLTLAAHLALGAGNREFSCDTPRIIDFASVLESALESASVEETLPLLAPQHPGYQRLRDALQVHRVMLDWPQIEPGKSMRKGDRGPRIAQLRARLGRSASTDRFDADLDSAVRDAQRHYGLADDGVAGPKTLAELNVPRTERMRQIATNLERWRWLPADLGERYLLVNIAAFQLDLVERGRSTLTMRIVAGKQYTRTPFFAAAVERVLLNPPWNVPSSIARKELWPKQQLDPGYFAREHIRVTRDGQLRQDPGPWCALGRIKFDMPNAFNVYLHDTPARSLFATDLRAFSHGCIRLEKPEALAVALTGWTPAEIEAGIATGKETTIRLPRPVPVYVHYWTAFVAEDGHVEFRRDIYGRDILPAPSVTPVQ